MNGLLDPGPTYERIRLEQVWQQAMGSHLEHASPEDWLAHLAADLAVAIESVSALRCIDDGHPHQPSIIATYLVEQGLLEQLVKLAASTVSAIEDMADAPIVELLER